VKNIRIAEPHLGQSELTYVNDCLSSNWISSTGDYISKFEKAFADFCGSKYAVSTNNGTTALHLALIALGVKPGDEIIVPNLTYIATLNSVTYCGAIPILVDIEENSKTLNWKEIESHITSKTVGIIPVHVYGHPANMTEINLIAQRHGLWVMEDAAEAHGAKVMGRKVGSLSNCGVFSFYGNKIITTGEGGMVVTNDPEIYSKLILFRGQGMDPKRRYWFPVIGFNYRMTNIAAAIGLGQLENVEQILERRAEIASIYKNELCALADKILVVEKELWAEPVNWLYTIYLTESYENLRDDLIKYLEDQGIETRPVFYPMHEMPPYLQKNNFPVTTKWSFRGINLPTHLNLTDEDIVYICSAIIKFFK
jgi:perosamine synthetase